jgi:hypothetical protein
MFGFDPISMAIVGGALGGLMDKKDPLRGAMLGGAGGYFAPGLLGAGEVAGAAAAGQTGVTAANAGMGFQAPSLATGGGGLGFQGTANLVSPSLATTAGGTTAQVASQGPMAGLKAFGEGIKPVGQAIQTASAAKNLFDPNTPVAPPPIAPPPVVGQGGAQALTQLASNNAGANIAQENQLRKQRRMGLLG